VLPQHHVLVEIARIHEYGSFILQFITNIPVDAVLALVDLTADRATRDGKRGRQRGPDETGDAGTLSRYRSIAGLLLFSLGWQWVRLDALLVLAQSVRLTTDVIAKRYPYVHEMLDLHG
jgi:hypothetical protein